MMPYASERRAAGRLCRWDPQAHEAYEQHSGPSARHRTGTVSGLKRSVSGERPVFPSVEVCAIIFGNQPKKGYLCLIIVGT